MTAGAGLWAACVDLGGLRWMATGLLAPGSRATDGLQCKLPAAFSERGQVAAVRKQVERAAEAQ